MRCTSNVVRIVSAMLLFFGLSGVAQAESRLTLISFNTWGGGLNVGKPIDETLAVLRAAAPDIAGLQEMRAEGASCTAEDCPPGEVSVAPSLAAALGLNLHEQHGPDDVVWACAILSRYQILRATPHDLGVVVDINGHRVAVFNIHPTDYPYQPYQLLEIPYGDAPFLQTAQQAEMAAAEARGLALRLLQEDLATVAETDAQIVFGDFNEPSWRDWTQRAVVAGQQPLEVDWPLTRALEGIGFTDALRAVYPDEVAKPAFTWTPTTAPDDPKDHHDRIDFVFVRGDGISIESATIVGEAAPAADLVVKPYPSDHRAVRVVVRLD